MKKTAAPAALLFPFIPLLSVLLLASPPAVAQNSWTGTGANNHWANAGNWSLGTVPLGTGTGTGTFDGAGNGVTTVDMRDGAGNPVTVGNIVFDSASAAAYTFVSTGTLPRFFTNTGGSSITVNAGVLNAQTFASRITMNGNLTVTNNSATSGATLTFSGSSIDQGGASGTRTLTLDGSNTGANTISPAIDDDGTGGTRFVQVVKAGTGAWTLTGANTYVGQTNVLAGTLIVNGSVAAASTTSVANGATLAGTGTVAGAVTLLGTLTADADPLTLGSLDWVGGTLSATLSPTSTPVAVSGALTRSGGGSRTIALTDVGAAVGVTYTLMTFGSVTGFSVSDFAVTGISGRLSLEANALKFTVTAPPVYGVSVAVAKGKDRATFTITNTGNTPTTFRVLPGALVTGRAGSKPTKGPKPAKATYKVIYTLDGTNISNAVATRTANTASVAPSANVQVVVKLKVLKKVAFKRKVRADLLAISGASPAITAKASASFTIPAGKK
jgi:autotransporter-associated beta strand protein